MTKYPRWFLEYVFCNRAAISAESFTRRLSQTSYESLKRYLIQKGVKNSSRRTKTHFFDTNYRS